jgi:DNA-binding MarR family transcriptional regulator
MDDLHHPSTAAALRIVLGQLARRLRQESQTEDLTWPQISVLGHLERDGPATVTALARAERMRPQSMGATIAVLEAAGLVTRTADPADGRQTILSLTPRCRDLIATNRREREDWLQRAILTHLSIQEQKDLAKSVDLLRRLVEL